MRFPVSLTFVFVVLGAMPVLAPAADCNMNGVDDLEDIAAGTSSDCDGNAVPDECDAEAAPGSAFWADCNGNGTFDLCDLADGIDGDCDANRVPDACDVQDLGVNANSVQAVFSGNEAQSLSTGDWDLDGDADLAVGDAASGGVHVLINEGGGSSWLEAEPVLSAGQQTLALTSADFNGDGINDLAAADFTSSAVYIHLGVGDGSFQFSQQSSVGNGPRSMGSGDLNNDGAVDIAVGNSEPAADSISLLINDGAGGFPQVALQQTGANNNIRAIQIHDLDDDGDQDLALACEVPGASAPNLTLMFNDGQGHFDPESKRDFTVGTDVLFDLTVADFDDDGDADIAAANSDGSLFIVRREADGEYLVISTGYVFQDPRGIVTFQLDGDSHPDLAITDGGSDQVRLLLNNGDGSFAASLIVDSSPCPWGLAGVDLDADGDDDLTSANGLGCGSGSVDVFLNSTVGGAADCDGNGAPDTCVLGEQVSSVWIGGISNWNDPENWCPNAVPDNVPGLQFDVTAEGFQGVLTLDLSPTMETLSLLSGASLEMNEDSGASSHTLTVENAVTNSGLILATDGREMVIVVPEIQQGIDGALQASIGDASEEGAESVIVIFGGSVEGGSACGIDAQSRIHLVDGAELAGVTVGGLRVPSGQAGGFRDDLYNTGNIEIGDGGGEAAFVPGVGGGTLIASGEGSASLTLNSTATSLSEIGHYFYAVTNGVDHAILGGGLIWGPFINDGVVQATSPEAPLILSSPGAKTNNGVLSADGGVLILVDDVVGQGSLIAQNGLLTLIPEDESLFVSGDSLDVGNGGSANMETGAEVTLGGSVIMSCGSGARGCTPPVITSGGGSKLEAGGDLDMQGDGELHVDEGAEWTLHGNFANQSTDGQGFDWQGALIMEGGTESDPQTFDAAGEDRGPNSAGFISNFSIGEFEIGTDTFVQVVDDFDNQEDGGAACDESVYVGTLILNSGSTLFTNGCKFYYEELVDLGGAIDKNVLPIEPGPPICPGDANGDEIVDPLDSGYVMSRFACSVGTGDAECDAADVNRDGRVDFLDTGYVSSRFGPCWD